MKPWTFLKDLLKSFKNFHIEKFHSDNRNYVWRFSSIVLIFIFDARKNIQTQWKMKFLKQENCLVPILNFTSHLWVFFSSPPFKISAKIIRSSSKVANFRGVMTPTIVQLQKFYTLESYQLNVLFETSLIKARYIS